MGRSFRTGIFFGLAAVTAKALWERPWEPEVAPSTRLDAWVPGAQFRDTIALAGLRANPAQVAAALDQVKLSDMPLAGALGRLRYLPGRLAGGAGGGLKSTDGEPTFLQQLQAEAGNLILEGDAEGELILGAIGRLHNVRDQAMVPLATTADFLAFDEPGHQKLAMSLRVVEAEPAAGLTLVLEHRTLALDEDARRLFALYWLAIKPGGAFVTTQLLQAVRDRAEALAAEEAG